MAPPSGYIEFSNPGIMRYGTIIPTIKTSYMRSLFTNNSQVYYQPHSLSSGGGGTVVNARRKSVRT